MEEGGAARDARALQPRPRGAAVAAPVDGEAAGARCVAEGDVIGAQEGQERHPAQPARPHIRKQHFYCQRSADYVGS